MRPADDTLLISLCSQVFTLKASLRAAAYLHSKYDGFGNLAKAINEGSFTAYQDLIAEGCTDTAALNAFLKPFHDPDALVIPLGESILANREELIEFVMKLAGAAQGGTPAADPIPYPEYFSRLYKLATGWLLWSPDQAWAASPNEIVAAFQGRMDQLKAVHGSGERDTDNTTTADIKSVKDRLNALGDSRVHSMADVP